jgi:hypothetical protein
VGSAPTGLLTKANAKTNTANFIMSSTPVSRANRYMLPSTPDLNTLAARPPTVS